MAKNKNNSKQGDLGNLNNISNARAARMPSGDKPNEINEALSKFSKKLDLIPKTIISENKQLLKAISGISANLDNIKPSISDDDIASLISGETFIGDIINNRTSDIINTLDGKAKGSFAKSVMNIEMYLKSLLTDLETPESKFNQILSPSVNRLESAIYSIAYGLWGNKIKENQLVTGFNGFKPQKDTLFGDIYNVITELGKSFSEQKSSSNDNSQPSPEPVQAQSQPIIDPMTVWLTQVQNLSELDKIISNGVDDSVVLDSINSHLEKLSNIDLSKIESGKNPTSGNSDNKASNATGNTSSMSGIVIDNKKASLDAISDTIEIIKKLNEIANSKDSKLLIISNDKLSKLKDVFSNYSEIIQYISDSMTNLSKSAFNSKDKLGDTNKTLGNMLESITTSFASIQNLEKINVKKVNKVFKQLNKIFEAGGPLSSLIEDMSSMEGIDGQTHVNIINSVAGILLIAKEFSDDNIDEIKEGVKNGIAIIGNPKDLKSKTLFGLNNKVKDLSKDIVDLSKSMNIEQLNKNVRSIRGVFSLYDLINSSLEDIDIDDIIDAIDSISSEDGLNSKIVGLIHSLENTFIQGGLTSDDLNIIDDTFSSIAHVMSKYSDMNKAFSIKTGFMLALKLEMLNDINSQLIKTGKKMSQIGALQNNTDVFIDGIEKMTDALDAIRQLNSSISIKSLSGLSVKSKNINVTLKDIKSLYRQFQKAFEKIDEDEIKEIIAKNGKLENLGKLVKTLSDITGSFEKLSITGKIGSGGIKSTVEIVKGVKEIVDILGDKDFSEKLGIVAKEKHGIANQIWQLSKLLLKVSLQGTLLMVPAITGSIGFKMASKMIASVQKIVIALSELDQDGIETSLSNIDNIKKISKGLTATCGYGILLGGLAFPAMLGFKIAKTALKLGLKKLITYIIGFFKDKKDYNNALENVTNIKNIVTSLTTVLACGAACAVLAPLAMIGFIMMIPALITLKLVLGTVNLIAGGKNAKINQNNAKEIAKLIMYLGGVMLIGGIIGGIVLKMMPNIIGFAVALSTFIFLVVGALNIALLGGGVRHLEHSASGIMKIVIMSSLIMLVGGAIMMFQPKLILYSLAWAIILGAFIFSLVMIIKSGAHAMKKAQSSLVYIMAFEVVTAAALLIPSAILAANPKMILTLFIWAGALAGFMFAMRAAMSTIPGKRKILKAASNIWAIAGLSIALAASVWVIVDASNRINDWGKLIGTVVSMFAILGSLVAGAWAISKWVGKIKTGLIAIAACEGLAIGLAVTMRALSWAVDSIKDTKTFNARVWSMLGIIGGIGAIAALLGSLSEFIYPGLEIIGALELLVIGLTVCMKEIAEACKAMAEASKLKIDSKGISSLIGSIFEIVTSLTPLGTPWFALNIWTVSKAVGSLGEAISKIAEGVADAADMHYTKYENGKKVGEFNLGTEDFVKAAVNTKTVVSVLGGAILDIYDENPEIFNTGTIVGDFLGNKTKFEKVVRSVSMLGMAISKISHGVQTAANLHYTKYENGKKVGEFNLSKSDFDNAANNTKIVVKTLGRAIMEAYDENPDIFTSGGQSSGFVGDTLSAIGDFFGAETKFSKVVKSVGALGNLISSIAGGVTSMANLTVTEYTADGKEKKRNIKPEDFTKAAQHTKDIVSALAQNIIDAYDARPDLFTSGSTLGDMLGFNPKFKNIVDTISSLGTLMSNIADGVKAFANNQIPVYGKGGEIVTYKKIGSGDYIAAGLTITTLISTMGDAIMSVYDAHPDWFKGNWWRFGSTSDNNTFTDVMKSLTGMSEMISKYAKAIQDYASGTITTYGEDGKILSKIPVNQSTYQAAANSVSACITTLSDSVYKVWNEHKDDIFDDDIFEPMIDNLSNLAKLVSKYSDSIKDFSNLYYDVYDDNGKKIGKKRVTSEDFTNAATTIQSVMTTMVTAVSDAYKTHANLFVDTNADPNKKSNGKTWFEQIINSFWSVGPLISSMSLGVMTYASLRIPLYNEDGTRKKGATRAMTEADFINAGNNIKTIMTKMVESVWSIYQNEQYREMFKNASDWGKTKDNSNPFFVMSEALNRTGIMVQNAAKATQDVINIKGFEDPKSIETLLNTRIGVITTALVNAINNAYRNGGNPNIFDDALSKDSVFLKVQTAMSSAYTLILEGIKVYTEAAKLDLDAITKLTGGNSTDVKANIMYKMIDGLAQPIMSVYNSVVKNDTGTYQLREMFDSVGTGKSMFTKIVEAIKSVSNIMSKVASVYDEVGKMKIGVADASVRIRMMLSGLVTPISDAYNGSKGAFDDVVSAKTLVDNIIPINVVVNGIKKLFGKDKPADTPAQRVVQAINSVTAIMGNVIKVYLEVAKIKVPIKETSVKVQTILTSLVSAVVNAANSKSINELDNLSTLTTKFNNINTIMFGENGKSGVIGTYQQMAALKIGSQREAHIIANKLSILLTTIPKIISNIISDKSITDSLGNVGDLANSMKTVSTAVNIIKGIYLSTLTQLNSLAKLSGKSGDEAVIYIGDSLSTMFNKLSASVELSNTGLLTSVSVMAQMKQSTALFKDSMNNLINIWNSIPTLNKDVEVFIPYMVKLQNELGNTPKLQEFVTETKNLIAFNDSVNRLQVKNVEVLTKLFIEFNKFSSKFGNLDKFTQVLATKMAKCLEYLADQIRDSAKTINKAEEIQNKRQKEIQKTIAEFKTLANMGLEVTVKSAEPEASTSSAGGGYSSGDNETNNSHEVVGQSTGSGSTASVQTTLQQINTNVGNIARDIRNKYR